MPGIGVMDLPFYTRMQSLPRTGGTGRCKGGVDGLAKIGHAANLMCHGRTVPAGFTAFAAFNGSATLFVCETKEFPGVLVGIMRMSMGEAIGSIIK